MLALVQKRKHSLNVFSPLTQTLNVCSLPKWLEMEAFTPLILFIYF